MVTILGITGGVATGKTTVAKALREILETKRCSLEMFDADASAHEILRRREILQEIILRFGVGVVQPDGEVDRRTLGHLVFGDESKRRQLEELIHPPVVEDFILKAKRLRDSGEAGCKCLIADIPLLFEVGAEKHCDLVVVVACTRSTQKRRLVSNRNVSSGVAEQMTLSQLPIEEKILRADGVVWSECSMAVLLEQLAFVTSRLETR